MGSMNSNNWLSFPLSPNQSSLPPHLQSSQSNQFTLGLLNETTGNPFQAHDWNLINSQDGSELPKIADFLGVNKSENQPDISAFNQMPATDSDYLFPSDALLSVQSTGAACTSDSDSQNANNIQSLTLSVGSVKGSNGENSGGNNNSSSAIIEATPRRSLDTFGQRTSIYRGVTRHRWTGRYEAHLWDNSCRREGQSRKGRQVYLGGYDKEEKAARAYDLAALKYWGTSTTTNFPISNYEQELEEMKHMTRQEFVAAIRRKSSGFSRGASIYRGVTRHHQHGRWQARIGRVAGNKDLYLGTFSTEEEAAEAYDIAAIKFRGLSAVTNFDMNRYDVKSILDSNVLPIGGGAAKRLKEAQAIESSRKRDEMTALSSSFQYGSSSNVQAYPVMQQFEQAQPFLALQNQPSSHYSQNPQFNQNYMHNHHQLHQNPTPALLLPNLNSAFHHGYIHTNPSLVHGMMNLGSPSSMMENNGSSSSYTGGYMGTGIETMETSTATNARGVGSMASLALVKADHDMSSGAYGGWSADSIQALNPGAFTMWND